jgi:CRP-like cAMP-binding protein
MFGRRQRESYLRDLELFADCTPAELEAIDSLATRLRVDQGQVLLHEGRRDRQFMVIVEGQVGVSRGQGAPIAVLRRGDFVGEIAMLTGEARSATVTALTPLELLVCNAWEFDALLRTAPSVKDKLVAAAVSRITANANGKAA